jgi:NAD(P)-dependent dehydrogenase (short-subunit alcohol dehydrogenase family)
MTDAEKIFTINAVGTINVNEEFGEVMKGGCILNVASMAGYMLPLEQVPTQLYEASAAGVEAFLGGAKQMLGMVPEEKQTGAAYTISKNFVQWYSRREAVKLGKKGIRVVSISPGTFSTPMGELEGEQANKLALMGALGRVGDPVEIAKMMNFILSDNCSYMTGVDVLYDGGVIAALEVTKAQQAPQE